MRFLLQNRALLVQLNFSRRFAQQHKCWKCSADVADGHFCAGCKTILPVGEGNLFEYIGMDTGFRVDDGVLRKKFRDLQFQLHPDKFAQSTSKEKELSEEHSRKLNEVYKTLSDPLARANYLLALEGAAESKDDLDTEKLMEMMEWNEHVATLRKEEELKEEKKKVQKEIDNEMEELGKAFGDKDYGKARSHVTLVTYLYSLRNSIDQKIQATLSH